MSSVLTILSRHTNLSDAVKAAAIDLSYNQQLAESDLRRMDRGTHNLKAVTESYVTNDGVYYVINCDIRILHKYTPFMSCMNDSPFSVCVITDTTIHIGAAGYSLIPKSAHNRKVIAKHNLLVA